MSRIELLKKVRAIYAEAETLRMKPENEKSKDENRSAISEVDPKGDKIRKVQN